MINVGANFGLGLRDFSRIKMRGGQINNVRTDVHPR